VEEIKMQEQRAMHTGCPCQYRSGQRMPKKQEGEMENHSDNRGDCMKNLKKLYFTMGGMPIVRMPAPRFRDQSFALHGRQVPRVLKYWGGDR